MLTSSVLGSEGKKNKVCHSFCSQIPKSMHPNKSINDLIILSPTWQVSSFAIYNSVTRGWSEEVNGVPCGFSRVAFLPFVYSHFHCKISRGSWVLSLFLWMASVPRVWLWQFMVSGFCVMKSQHTTKKRGAGQWNLIYVRQVKSDNRPASSYQSNDSSILYRLILQCVSELVFPFGAHAKSRLLTNKQFTPLRVLFIQSPSSPIALSPMSWQTQHKVKWLTVSFSFLVLLNLFNLFLVFRSRKLHALFSFSFICLHFSFPKCFISLPLLQWT